MKTLLVLCILALTMSAKTSTEFIGLPNLNIGLGGSSEAPEVQNNSGRNIIGYVLGKDDGVTTDGVPIGVGGFPELKLGSLARGGPGIAAGSKDVYASGPMRKTKQDGTLVIPAKVYLDSVIMPDGQFVGPNTLNYFHEMTLRIEGARAFAKKVLTDQSQLSITLQVFRSDPRSLLVTGTVDEYLTRLGEYAAAHELESIQADGPDAVKKAAERLVNLPKLWK